MNRIAWIGAGLALFGSSLFGEVVYSNIPGVIPPNVASVGYQATQTAEFGNAVTLATGGRVLTTVEFLLSNWALESTYETVGTSSGYNVPLTANLYNVDPTTGAIGTLITTLTTTQFIPWRPEASAGCGTAWLAANNQCYNGLATPVTFDFSSLGVTLPDNVIATLAFNTQSWGANPTGTGGPYNSLNFGVEGSVNTGSNLFPGDVYWNTSTASNYTDPTLGSGYLRQDTQWDPYQPEIQIDAVTPEPGTFILLSGALLVLGIARRKKILG